MDRRSFFRVLGLGAASVAAIPAVAVAAKLAEQPETMVPGRYLGDGNWEAVPISRALPSHTHWSGGHTHGCMVHSPVGGDQS